MDMDMMDLQCVPHRPSSRPQAVHSSQREIRAMRLGCCCQCLTLEPAACIGLH
ncbi:hypothetical protein BC826DRAFT_1052479 [Russula brevipes]|nr:hypothetical protein BC826DRAFT_1052479 [Russula brevipes]